MQYSICVEASCDVHGKDYMTVPRDISCAELINKGASVCNASFEEMEGVKEAFMCGCSLEKYANRLTCVPSKFKMF